MEESKYTNLNNNTNNAVAAAANTPSLRDTPTQGGIVLLEEQQREGGGYRGRISYEGGRGFAGRRGGRGGGRRSMGNNDRDGRGFGGGRWEDGGAARSAFTSVEPRQPLPHQQQHMNPPPTQKAAQQQQPQSSYSSLVLPAEGGESGKRHAFRPDTLSPLEQQSTTLHAPPQRGHASSVGSEGEILSDTEMTLPPSHHHQQQQKQNEGPDDRYNITARRSTTDGGVRPLIDSSMKESMEIFPARREDDIGATRPEVVPNNYNALNSNNPQPDSIRRGSYEIPTPQLERAFGSNEGRELRRSYDDIQLPFRAIDDASKPAFTHKRDYAALSGMSNLVPLQRDVSQSRSSPPTETSFRSYSDLAREPMVTVKQNAATVDQDSPAILKRTTLADDERNTSATSSYSSLGLTTGSGRPWINRGGRGDNMHGRGGRGEHGRSNSSELGRGFSRGDRGGRGRGFFAPRGGDFSRMDSGGRGGRGTPNDQTMPSTTFVNRNGPSPVGVVSSSWRPDHGNGPSPREVSQTSWQPEPPRASFKSFADGPLAKATPMIPRVNSRGSWFEWSGPPLQETSNNPPLIQAPNATVASEHSSSPFPFVPPPPTKDDSIVGGMTDVPIVERSQSPPTPEPSEPSGLVLALTRLADMEAQMEYEFAKLTRLTKEQQRIRTEYEVLEKMPVGMAAFQNEYDAYLVSLGEGVKAP